ncbi:hypothetical protein SteCoe_2261 [Stentor coeruleus]|uniref:Uncharacterized protein n=1 Tax=Stentor coeruleus TaxID=5963 RepID=A0A1R2CZT9_9CILI|nr:hypothetical protein SteCoe_2261 [Stentor coeruleus]
MGKTESKPQDLYSISELDAQIDKYRHIIQQIRHLPFKTQSFSTLSEPNPLSFEEKISLIKENIKDKSTLKMILFQKFNLDYAFADSSITQIHLMKNSNTVIVLLEHFIKLWHLDDKFPSKTLCIGSLITNMSLSNNEKFIIFSTEHYICSFNFKSNEQRIFPFESYIEHNQFIYSKDDKYVAYCLSSNILLFDSESMEKIFDAAQRNLQVECIVLTNDNKYIIAVVTLRYLRNRVSAFSETLIYSLIDTKIIKNIDFIKFQGLKIKISDDNKYLVSDSNNKTIIVWNLQLILSDFENFKQYQEPLIDYNTIQKKYINNKETYNSKYKISEKKMKVSFRSQYQLEITKDNKYILIYNDLINEFRFYDIITMSLEKRIKHKKNSFYSYFMLSNDFQHIFAPERLACLKKLSTTNSDVSSYNFFGSEILIQTFCLSSNNYLFTCFSTDYKDIKLSPFTVYSLEGDQLICFCIENKFALVKAAVTYKRNYAIVNCINKTMSLWDLTSSKAIKRIYDINAAQLEISEDDSKSIVLDINQSIIIFNILTLEKLITFSLTSMIVIKINTKMSTIILENQQLKVLNQSNKNHREIYSFSMLTKCKKYCVVPSLSRDKIYVINVQGEDEFFKIL